MASHFEFPLIVDTVLDYRNVVTEVEDAVFLVVFGPVEAFGKFLNANELRQFANIHSPVNVAFHGAYIGSFTVYHNIFQLVFAESQVARNEKLSDSGFASTQRLDQAVATRDEVQARIAETDAALSSVEIRIRKSRLRAPFTGHVAERIVDGGETLAPGQQVLRLVDTTATTVRVGVPLATDMDQLKDAQVIVGAQTFQARLESVRPDIDPVTRTRTAILSIDTPPNLAFGRTATVVLTDRIETPGAWVPMDSVQEGRGSVWTVLVVDDDSKVRNAAVEILHAEADRMYVRGSFESGAQLIEAGPQRVTPGQTVRVMTGG